MVVPIGQNDLEVAARAKVRTPSPLFSDETSVVALLAQQVE